MVHILKSNQTSKRLVTKYLPLGSNTILVLIRIDLVKVLYIHYYILIPYIYYPLGTYYVTYVLVTVS
jgi:hypothetical protein